jgi:phenylpyruvate tautomerase PptA (4-oxalocrotonate tautomerase family)
MPYLKIQTNQTVDGARCQAIITKASQLVARQLGKPEGYMMVTLQPGAALVFAGKPDPAAFLEMKSIGLPSSKTKAVSKMLCEFVEAELKVPKDRIYIEFADAPGAMWGWNGDTFG